MSKKSSKPIREQLIYHCRYYRGQESNPYTGIDVNKSMLWFYEYAWVEQMLQESEKNNTLAEYYNDYVKAGLRDFRATDSIPISYKALLFNRFMKDSMDGNIQPFKDFYNKYY